MATGLPVALFWERRYIVWGSTVVRVQSNTFIEVLPAGRRGCAQLMPVFE